MSTWTSRRSVRIFSNFFASSWSALLAISMMTFSAEVATSQWITVSPGSGGRGAPVSIDGGAFGAGGFLATIRFDGSNQTIMSIPAGGSWTDFGWNIPPTAAVGTHTITVCVACDDPEFEFTASAPFVVDSAIAPLAAMNVQAIGLEVTQGVRGDVPTRSAPGGPFVLPADGIEHIANRRTVVRAFPWVDPGGLTFIPPLSAELHAYEDGIELPGSPILPVNVTLPAMSTLPTLMSSRSSPLSSWLFVLPDAWIHTFTPLGGPDQRTLDLKVRVNPPGPYNWPESVTTDNELTLQGQVFRELLGETFVDLAIHPYFVRQFRPVSGGGSVEVPPPDRGDLSAGLLGCDRRMPLATGSTAKLILPPREISYEGVRDVPAFNALARRLAPGGSLLNLAHGTHILTLWPRSCAGGMGLQGLVLVDACSSFPGIFVSHELGHSLGRLHPGTHETGFFDPAYPNPHGSVESDTWGFDLWNYNVLPPTGPAATFSEGVVHDVLSGGGLPKWLSRYHWNLLISDIEGPAGTSAKAVANGEYLLVTGIVDQSNVVTLEPLVATTTPLRPAVVGEYWIEVRDSGGLAMNVEPLGETGLPHTDEYEMTFSAPVFFPTGWASMAILHGQQPIYATTRSANPPFIQMIAPGGGETWPNGTTQTVSWFADDPDADPLSFRVEGSLDGQTWYALAEEVTAMSADIPVGNVPAGDTSLLLRVQASDGHDVALTPEVQVNVGAKPPVAMILHPPDSLVVLASEPLSFHGLGTDWQDGRLEGTALSWRLNGAPLGEGTDLDLAGITPGVHVLALEATNSRLLTDQTSVTITALGDLGAGAPNDPPHGSVQPSPNVRLAWDPVPGAVSYCLELFESAGTAAPVLQVCGHQATEYSPQQLQFGADYAWRVRPESTFRYGEWSNLTQFSVATDPTSVAEPPRLGAPVIAFLPGAANPVHTAAEIPFELYRSGEVTIRVYDLRGRLVRTLLDGNLDVGEHRVVWNGRAHDGRRVSSGSYFVAISWNHEPVAAKRLVLLR